LFDFVRICATLRTILIIHQAHHPVRDHQPRDDPRMAGHAASAVERCLFTPSRLPRKVTAIMLG